MMNLEKQKEGSARLTQKDYPVQKVALKDNRITEEIIEESVEELNPDDGTLERG